jgi:hypothetical protein
VFCLLVVNWQARVWMGHELVHMAPMAARVPGSVHDPPARWRSGVTCSTCSTVLLLCLRACLLTQLARRTALSWVLRPRAHVPHPTQLRPLTTAKPCDYVPPPGAGPEGLQA